MLYLLYALERAHLLFFLLIFIGMSVFNYFLYLFLATVLLDCSSFIYICFLFTHPHLKVSLFHFLFIPLICNPCSSDAYDLSNVLPVLPVLLLFPSIFLNRIFLLTILKLHYACLRNILLNFHNPFLPSVASHLIFPLIYLSVPSVC